MSWIHYDALSVSARISSNYTNFKLAMMANYNPTAPFQKLLKSFQPHDHLFLQKFQTFDCKKTCIFVLMPKLLF